ncbi:MAG: D-alanine--D-alanine ligase [Deltaproteobacteria bacterium]|nr:D-alanine--D-alanine ligase [Deltaproteobacteria bacterium]MCB9786476.1 D-alanine--D-alanine ligase [Deltaproteobacteria bacterium]
MRVAVLMGGRSGEHDVSLVSGAAVVGALTRLGREAWPLTFGRDGRASWPGGEGPLVGGLAAMMAVAVDVAFVAMHGAEGEDGRVQGALELLGVPYQGSDVAASAVCLDKLRTKQVYEAASLPVARDVRIHRGDRWDAEQIAAELGLPVVVKTAESGSSVGVEVVATHEELAARIEALLAESAALVCETWLPGREFTCAVLERGAGSAEALPLIEIRPRDGRFFDYQTKYDPDAVDEICPAAVDEALGAEMRALGERAHKALGCRDYSRTDIKLDAAGRPHLLETNTLPGLTAASLMPKAAAAAGLGFDALIAHLCDRAFARRRG